MLRCVGGTGTSRARVRVAAAMGLLFVTEPAWAENELADKLAAASNAPLAISGAVQTPARPQALLPKHLRPVPSATAEHLKAAGLSVRDPIYMRVFKEESEFEVWKARRDGTFVHVKTFPICTFSGALGPKQRYADYQSPEGFYTVTANLMRPNSNYHLAFNIGYPNAVDRSLGRTGDLIMVHGACKSVGCFAMTNGQIEEIYALTREALGGGQAGIPVHSFPFRMTADNMARHATHTHAATWEPLQQAYQAFEVSQRLPTVAMCGKSYVVNPVWFDGQPAALDASAPCPLHIQAAVVPSLAVEGEIASGAIALMGDSPKMRTPENIANWGATRAKMSVLSAKQRVVRREKVRQLVAARDAADSGIRSNLGMGAN